MKINISVVTPVYNEVKSLHPLFESLHKFDNEKVTEAFSRIECHYFINKGFFEYDGWILNNLKNIHSIPLSIVQGRYDVVCPMISAWELHRTFPEADFEVVQNAGHSMTEEGIAEKLVEYTNKFSMLEKSSLILS
mgnify:CR=1 FL=1